MNIDETGSFGEAGIGLHSFLQIRYSLRSQAVSVVLYDNLQQAIRRAGKTQPEEAFPAYIAAMRPLL